jgi:23S rRNA C2498 (ribose-2'-O)-methylase RlmM
MEKPIPQDILEDLKSMSNRYIVSLQSYVIPKSVLDLYIEYLDSNIMEDTKKTCQQLTEDIFAASRENGYRLAVLDFQEILLESKATQNVWMNPQELFSHLADSIAHATDARSLNNFTPEKEYQK